MHFGILRRKQKYLNVNFLSTSLTLGQLYIVILIWWPSCRCSSPFLVLWDMFRFIRMRFSTGYNCRGCALKTTVCLLSGAPLYCGDAHCTSSKVTRHFPQEHVTAYYKAFIYNSPTVCGNGLPGFLMHFFPVVLESENVYYY